MIFSESVYVLARKSVKDSNPGYTTEHRTSHLYFRGIRTASVYDENRHECFTRKYTTREISITSLISCLTLRLCLNVLVYDRNIFGSSSNVFGNLRTPKIAEECRRLPLKLFDNVRVALSQFLENLRKSLESGWKSSENRPKRRYQ